MLRGFESINPFLIKSSRVWVTSSSPWGSQGKDATSSPFCIAERKMLHLVSKCSDLLSVSPSSVNQAVISKGSQRRVVL